MDSTLWQSMHTKILSSHANSLAASMLFCSIKKGRVFCKKGCGADGETWEDCLDECNEICYKDPVLKDRQWTAYIDRSPGSASYSEECFKACKAGCGYKFEIHPVEVDKARPNRPCNSLPSEKPPPVQKPPPQAVKHGEPTEDVPCTSA